MLVVGLSFCDLSCAEQTPTPNPKLQTAERVHFVREDEEKLDVVAEVLFTQPHGFVPGRLTNLGGLTGPRNI